MNGDNLINSIMEVVTLKRVNNGWMLIWDDPALESPQISVKEGRGSLGDGLIDDFVDTFMLDDIFYDEDIHPTEDAEFQVKIDVVYVKPSKKQV
jgi:hypothetical protein